MSKYQITKEECKKQIKGVCEGCGRKLEPIETIDNSNQPTFWVGCKHCSSFRAGVSKVYFDVARELVKKGEFVPYSHLQKNEYENTPERLDYWFDSQTAGLSHRIAQVDRMLIKAKAEEVK